MNALIKEYKYLIGLVIFAIFLRFSYDLPVIFVDDSVKYKIPLQIIATKNFDWILNTLNFSLLARIINYFVQSLDYGSTQLIIYYEKILSVFSTIIVYLISLKLTKKNHGWALMTAFVFTINPLMLFFEQVVMPETLFIFISLLMLWSFMYLIEKQSWHYALAFGASLGLLMLTKETGSFYGLMIYAATFIVGIFFLWKHKTPKFFIFLAIIFCSSQALRLPFKLYTYNKHGEFAMSRFHTGASVIWFLTEKMVYENPSEKYQWVTDGLKEITQQYKARFNVPLDKENRLAFENAIVKFSVSGREGRLFDPSQNKVLSSKEWSEIGSAYWLDTILKNPSESWKSILYNANIFLLRDNYYLKPYKKSSRPGLDYQAVPYTPIPFSLKSKLDPKLKGKKMIVPQFMDEYQVYTDASKSKYLKDIFLIMAGAGYPQAFVLPEKGLAIALQKFFQKLPFMRILLPLFIINIFMFAFNEKLRKTFEISLVNLYLIGSNLFFIFLPLLVHGEARYRLQFTHLMILLISHSIFLISRSIRDTKKS